MYKTIIGGFFLGAFALLLSAHTAFAAAPFTLFGGGSNTAGGVVLVSDMSNTSTTDDSSGSNFIIPTNMTFADITELSAQYDIGDDDCGGGSPRYQVNVDTGSGTKNVMVYFGPTPNFTGCLSGIQSTGNFIATADARFDLSQVGGPFYGTYQDALNLVGSMKVTGMQLVVDSGWLFPDQEQSIRVGTPVVSFKQPTASDQCKNGGWMAFSNPTFKNQGDCVSSVASKGKAGGNPQ